MTSLPPIHSLSIASSNDEQQPAAAAAMQLISDLPSILRLPLENTHHIIYFISPDDVAALSQTCRTFFTTIYESYQYIWRDQFLQIWDDSRCRIAADNVMAVGPVLADAGLMKEAIAEIEYDWKQELRRRFSAAKLIRKCRYQATAATCAQRKEVLKTLLSICHTALPPTADDAPSKNGEWLISLLRGANALNYSLWPTVSHFADSRSYMAEEAPDLEEHEICSELHLYIGLTDEDVQSASIQESDDEDDVVAVSSSGAGPASPTANSDDGVQFAINTLFSYNLRSRVSGVGGVSLLGAPHQTHHTPNIRTLARAFVYDLSNYTPSNKFAPLLKDLQGGYKAYNKHLEHIMVDILWNLREDLPLMSMQPGETVEELRARCRPPLDIDSMRSWTAPGFKAQMEAHRVWEEARKLDDQGEPRVEGNRADTEWHDWEDWAGVEGVWNRVVCFMDYRDLARYNWSAHPGRVLHTRNISVFEEEDFTEATRLLTLEMRITSIERNPPPSRPLSSTAIRLNRPRIRFSGRSRGTIPWADTQEQSRLTGYVECLASGDTRWHMITHYGGEARWSSEAVQIGGVGSATGSIGTWTGVEHDPTDPVGPFWSWKVAGREGLMPKSPVPPPSWRRF